jgi:hypothetical protein
MDLEDKLVRVENYSNSSQEFSPRKEGNSVSFDPNGEGFVLIKVSGATLGTTEADTRFNRGEFQAGPDSQGETVKIAYIGIREVYSEASARLLADNYFSDYPGLRDSFNFKNNDFAFDLVLSKDDRVSGTRFVPVGIEVYSDYKRGEVLREDGTITFADLNVRVW